MRKKSNMGLFATIAVLILLIGGIATYLFLSPKESAPEETDLSGRELADHVVSYQEDGMIRLYSLTNKKELEEFDLKTLSETKVTKTEEVVREEIKKPKKENPKKGKEELKGYKDFDQIRVTIVKYDNAWNIQTALTPKRNTTQMLKYVQELNNGYKMHPIFPGEQYMFLKEKGDIHIDEEKIGIVIEEVIEAEPTYVEKVVVKEVEEKEDSYIFYRDFDSGIVYAHSDFNNMVYKIEVNDNQLHVEKYLNHEPIGNPSQLLVKDSHVLLGFQDTSDMYHLHDKQIKKVTLEGVPEVWEATNEKLIYAFEDFIGSYDLQSGKLNKALLGDKTKDFVIQESDVYVLNQFGEKTENNLLMKVDTKTLDVEELVELQANKTSLVSKGDREFVWINSVMMTGSKGGVRVEEPQVLSFSKDPLKLDKKAGWKMPHVTNGQVFDAYLYALEGESLKAYKEKSEKPSVELDVKGSEYLIIKK